MTVLKERIYASNGKLYNVDLSLTSAYSVSATDVRSIKLDHTKTKFKLVWSNGSRVSDLVKQYGADYGINAPFFWSGLPVADCKIGSQILNQGYDTVGGAQQTKWHGVEYKAGKLSLGYSNINDDLGTDGFLFKTTPYLIDNGNPAWDWFRDIEGTAPDIGKDANGNYVRANRTFIGTDANGDIIIAASDGRTSTNKGLTLEEMSLFMQGKGAINALNLDGGSSTVIADQTGMLNVQPTGEKAVGHALLVFINKDWRQEGFDYLVQNYQLDAGVHTPTELVDLGMLGTLLKRRGL